MVVDQPYEAITSQPLKSIKDRIRLTEQGEVIGNKYGNKDAAYYNLEMLVSAAINRMITQKKSDTNTSNRYEAIMDQVVDRSYDIYRDLVFGNDHFYDYFFESSPIKAISSFNIGSRPAARKTITEIRWFASYPLGILMVSKSCHVPWLVWGWFKLQGIYR